jgi:hypothetical protein
VRWRRQRRRETKVEGALVGGGEGSHGAEEVGARVSGEAQGGGDRGICRWRGTREREGMRQRRLGRVGRSVGDPLGPCDKQLVY